MFEKIHLMLKVLAELGAAQTGLYGLYQLGLRTGYYARLTPPRRSQLENVPPVKYDLFFLPSREELLSWVGDGLEDLITEADEIASGQIRLFGGAPVRLNLEPPDGQVHWTLAGKRPTGDIKLVWEPARFGWVFTLGRAYLASQDERYPAVFWRYFEFFQAANPANCGPNWESGQEVALRLIALAFGGHVFNPSGESTPERVARLSAALVAHARRIPPTLVYARAQNNNHLISESLGLYLAGLLLEPWPEAQRWKNKGWHWLNYGLQHQINDEGCYIQHSINYHRLMLQLALVAAMAARQRGERFPEGTKKKLALATRWYISVLDPISGAAPNLGHNDGALLLPLDQGGYRDHRATAQSAAMAFLGAACLQTGPWDELGAWLGLERPTGTILHPPGLDRITYPNEWGTLRAVTYRSRPAHADQLQVELWHNGVNIIKDPGSYSYNLSAPWDNGLACAGVHNAPVMDRLEPMQRAGRFLWLSWDQARWIKMGPGTDRSILSAERLGYRKMGILHRRDLSWVGEGSWKVTDQLREVDKPTGEHDFQLNWLFPDGEWTITDNTFKLMTSKHTIIVKSQPSETTYPAVLRLVRGGRVVYGPNGEFPLHGWYAPSYLLKKPALSLLMNLRFVSPFEITTSIQINP